MDVGSRGVGTVSRFVLSWVVFAFLSAGFLVWRLPEKYQLVGPAVVGAVFALAFTYQSGSLRQLWEFLRITVIAGVALWIFLISVIIVTERLPDVDRFSPPRIVRTLITGVSILVAFYVVYVSNRYGWGATDN